MRVIFSELGLSDRIIFCKNGKEVVDFFKNYFLCFYLSRGFWPLDYGIISSKMPTGNNFAKAGVVLFFSTCGPLSCIEKLFLVLQRRKGTAARVENTIYQCYQLLRLKQRKKTSKSTLHHANPQQEYAFFALLSSGSLRQYEEREF